jgi:hypothetical protein
MVPSPSGIRAILLETGLKSQAHLPKKLIRTRPATKHRKQMPALRGPACASGPWNHSTNHISANPTHNKIPALKALRVPIAMSVEGSLPLNDERTPIPIAMPTGVVMANAAPRRVLRVKLLGIIAILAPRANPSKTWWKTITMKSVMKPESAATTSVNPITVGSYVSGPISHGV